MGYPPPVLHLRYIQGTRAGEFRKTDPSSREFLEIKRKGQEEGKDGKARKKYGGASARAGAIREEREAPH